MGIRACAAVWLLVAQLGCASSSFGLVAENAAALAARILMRSEQTKGSENGLPASAEEIQTQVDATEKESYVANSLEVGSGYKAAPVGKCKHRVGEGKIRMMGKHCRAMGGTIASDVADSTWYDCPLDFCKDGNFSAAAVGKCKVKVGYGIIKMEARDCRGMGGAMTGTPADSVWTDCHLDWCNDGTFSANDIGQCQVKRGFGKIQMKAGWCDSMGGLKEVAASTETYVHCAFDWCYTTDCLYHDWSEWGGCSATCDGGFHLRNRGVLVEAMYGGRQCPEHLRMGMTVQEKACAQDQICWGSPCEDYPADWTDKDGDTCNVYEWGDLCGHYRTEGTGWHVKGTGVTFTEFRGTSDRTAVQACCACGGGRKPSR